MKIFDDDADWSGVKIPAPKGKIVVVSTPWSVNAFQKYYYGLWAKPNEESMNMVEANKEPFKAPNAPLLKLKLEKEKELHKDAKYFVIKRFIKYSINTADYVSFSSKIVQELREKKKKGADSYWAVCELYIPTPALFKPLKYEDYTVDRHGNKKKERIGIVLPKEVMLKISCPKNRDATGIKNHMTKFISKLFFLENRWDIDERELYNDPTIKQGNMEMLCLLLNKNWSFSKDGPDEYVTYFPYKMKQEGEFKDKPKATWRKPDGKNK